MKHLFTSESVSQGHPDKVADQISDAILDAMLAQDPNSRVACETMVTTGIAFIAGEITTDCYVDMPQIVRDTIRDIGYCSSQMGFDCQTCAVVTSIDRQSSDIAQGVTAGMGLHLEQGAGDQGMMFGYATGETDELMPMSLVFAHGLVREMAHLRKNTDLMPYLRPDSKSQVTIEYDDDRRTPRRVHTVVVSTQHDEDVTLAQIREDVVDHLLPRVIPSELLDDDLILHVNPTGRFVIGGPHGDAGLTGRKIIVDTYGGRGAHGGGAFSGKDATKVDRSAAYAARHVAKNLVGAGLADEVLVQVAYAIGVAEPVSIDVNTYRTGKVPDAQLVQVVRELFDLRPAAIIRDLDLRKPIFRKTAAYGHFGRDEFTWEQLDRVEDMKSAAAAAA